MTIDKNIVGEQPNGPKSDDPVDLAVLSDKLQMRGKQVFLVADYLRGLASAMRVNIIDAPAKIAAAKKARDTALKAAGGAAGSETVTEEKISQATVKILVAASEEQAQVQSMKDTFLVVQKHVANLQKVYAENVGKLTTATGAFWDDAVAFEGKCLDGEINTFKKDFMAKKGTFEADLEACKPKRERATISLGAMPSMLMPMDLSSMGTSFGTIDQARSADTSVSDMKKVTTTTQSQVVELKLDGAPSGTTVSTKASMQTTAQRFKATATTNAGMEALVQDQERQIRALRATAMDSVSYKHASLVKDTAFVQEAGKKRWFGGAFTKVKKWIEDKFKSKKAKPLLISPKFGPGDVCTSVVASKFRTPEEADKMSDDDCRNTLITEINKVKNNEGKFKDLQGKQNADLIKMVSDDLGNAEHVKELQLSEDPFKDEISVNKDGTTTGIKSDTGSDADAAYNKVKNEFTDTNKWWHAIRDWSKAAGGEAISADTFESKAADLSLKFATGEATRVIGKRLDWFSKAAQASTKYMMWALAEQKRGAKVETTTTVENADAKSMTEQLNAIRKTTLELRQNIMANMATHYQATSMYAKNINILSQQFSADFTTVKSIVESAKGASTAVANSVANMAKPETKTKYVASIKEKKCGNEDKLIKDYDAIVALKGNCAKLQCAKNKEVKCHGGCWCGGGVRGCVGADVVTAMYCATGRFGFGVAFVCTGGGQPAVCPFPASPFPTVCLQVIVLSLILTEHVCGDPKLSFYRIP